MISAHETYSFRRKGTGRRLLRYLLLILLVLILYLIVTRFFVLTLRIDSVSMQPALNPGDRVLATPLALGIPLSFLPQEMTRYRDPGRGDLVVFRLPGDVEATWYAKALESVVRFGTLNRRSLASDRAGMPLPWVSVKRVVGVPGDIVRIVDRVAFVRQADGSFVPEDDLAARDYSVNTRLETEAVARQNRPGETQELRLGANDYLLLGDNRPLSSDSRSWGVVDRERISAVVVLRYWPLGRLGRP